MRKLTKRELANLFDLTLSDAEWQNAEYRRAEAFKAHDFDLAAEWEAVQLERQHAISYKLVGFDAIWD